MKYYVNKDLNKVPGFMQKHINKGDRVIVTDCSYMEASTGETIRGIDFQNQEGLYEVLTVIDTNVPFPTDTKRGSVLTVWNNCSIQGMDGKIYYCSRINIEQFSL